MLDFYDLLGVEKTASQKEIKTAFHKLARELHPDQGGAGDPGKQRRFRALSEAYAVIGNGEKRQQYDAGGSAASIDPRVRAAGERIAATVVAEAEKLADDAIDVGFQWLRSRLKPRRPGGG